MADTHASRTLALLEAAIEGRLPGGTASYSIGGRNIAKIPLAELHSLRLKYKQEVAAENGTLALKNIKFSFQ